MSETKTKTKTLEQRIGLLEKEIRNLKRQNQATIEHMTKTDKFVIAHETLRQQLQDDFK